MFTQLIGTLAAILTTSAFLPQAIKIHKTKETKAISLLMFSVLNIGNTCWLVYGVLTTQWPIIIANIITLTLSGYILYVKWKNVKSGFDY